MMRDCECFIDVVHIVNINFTLNTMLHFNIKA